MKIYLILVFLCYSGSLKAKDGLKARDSLITRADLKNRDSMPVRDGLYFTSFSALMAYADSHSLSFKNASQQSLLARYQTITARWNRLNFQGESSFTLTDNTRLMTNFIPAQFFGGPAGTFRPVIFGQHYVSTLTLTRQVDLLNPGASAQLRLAKINQRLTGLTNLINKKELYENAASNYFTIISDQWQRTVTLNSLKTADTLLIILRNKQLAGIARQQDVNNALTSKLGIQDKLQQLEAQLEQQYNSLKILCDIPLTQSIEIHSLKEQPGANLSAQAPLANGTLLQQQGEQQHSYQLADLRANRWKFFPVLSAFGDFGYQQFTNVHFLDNSRWFPSSYLGMKLSIPLFLDVNKHAAMRYSRINSIIAENNMLHYRLQDSINNRQLNLDYVKAFTSYTLGVQIEALKKDSYNKNLNIYKEGVLSSTDLFNSFDDWLNSSLNTAALLAQTEFAGAKIEINNLVK